MKVLFFGDSIVTGYDDSEGGWVKRLRKAFGDKFEFINFAVPGNSSFDVLRQLSDETIIYTGTDAIVIGVGVNDSRIKNGHHFTDIENYVRNLEKIYAHAKKHADKVLFVGLTPCDDNLTIPVDWDSTIYKNSRIDEFNCALRDFCIKNSINFVEIFEPFKDAMKDSSLLSDGLHPNEDGHQLITDLVKPHLQKLI